jgi:hypothetical protein
VIDHLLQEDWDAAASSLREHLQDACEVWLKRFESVTSEAAATMPPYISPLDVEERAASATK